MPDEIKEKEQAPQVLTESDGKGRENRRRKRIRQRASSSQTEDELLNEEHVQGVQSSCTICNNKLDLIQEKLDKVLSFIPEVENLRSRIVQLEEEKENMKQSLEFTQAEVRDLKSQVKAATEELIAANKEIVKTNELERRISKQECFNRRNNIKFFGVKDADDESPRDTETTLRKFLKKEMQITNDELENIQFERVHRIPTCPKTSKQVQPRPIIAKVTFFQDKEFIKSHIKNLPKGAKYGVADDFPKEVDAIRKALQPKLKQARGEKKMAFFNVEKLVIEGIVYHGPETKTFPHYGRIMDNG